MISVQPPCCEIFYDDSTEDAYVMQYHFEGAEEEERQNNRIHRLAG